MSISSPSMPVPLTCIVGIQYGEAEGIPLYLDLLYPYPLPDKPLPTVVYLPCSGWYEAHRGWAMNPDGNPLLAAHGFVTVSASLRLSWQAPFPAQIHDVKAVIRWLRANAQRYAIDPERIGVYGSSAGGHLASLLGLTAGDSLLEGKSGSPGYSSQVQAVMTICAPSDFFSPGGELLNDAPLPPPVTQLFGGTVREKEEMMRLASPLSHVRSDAPPFLIVHGTHDETVPFQQGQALHEALQAVGAEVTFMPIQNAYHNLREDPALPWEGAIWHEMGQLALRFFQQHLCH
ncbi:MAG TPA: alpha/beta hydrolase [Ktedonobacteraceae bacterium]|nr:alpha/beta hydrolase [Ktedonobacteraceae bacterium]